MNKNLFYCLLLFISTNSYSQKSLSKEDYDRANQVLWQNLTKYIDNQIYPQWRPDGKIYYKVMQESFTSHVLFNPIDGTKTKANSKKELLPNEDQTFKPNISRNEILSPDGSKLAFIKNWNLWLRELSSGKETQLTKDGIKDFGYATDNAGWTHSDKAILRWSPDSKKIATYQQDQRHVKSMYLVKTKVGSPELEEWKYPMPADSMIIMIHRVIIDLTKSPKVIKLKLSPDARRGSLCDDISCEGGFDDTEWSHDSKQLAFVSTPRDHKKATLRLANAETGEVKTIYEESVTTQYESGQGTINWKFFPKTNEFIWYSEKTDWGHLYLHDLTTGKLKKQITSGNFVVTRIIKIDEANRLIYFEAKGFDPNQNPYFSQYFSVNFDGQNQLNLTPEKGDHSIEFSPDGKYFTDTYSTPQTPQTYVVKDLTGKVVGSLEKTDITRLTSTGWTPPTSFTVKSADAKWDLYGMMYKPSNIDATKKYPVVIYIYPGPQAGSISSWTFPGDRGGHQALAELGFIVFTLNGTCNPDRSKSFHDVCYGSLGDNTLADQVSGLKELAQRYPFIDLNNVGMWGHSGGGNATVDAMLTYPDFIKVGVAQSGNHDTRSYEDDWGERYIGLEKIDKGKSNYEHQANQLYVNNLKGKLLLVHGGMDDNVPPYISYTLADALIKANKDFDFLIFPNARHGYGRDNSYMMRKRWDYFVKHLMKADYPAEYKITYTQDPREK
jgi:dipeptidyl-peptidase 4